MGMCIAIYKPAGLTISRSRLRRCWDRNPHGGGFALPDGKGGIAVHKAMTWDGFERAWAESAETDQPMVVHFRLATHGAKNLDNCHPHRVHDDLVMAHNGIISTMTRYATTAKSDTVAFVERVLAKVPTDELLTERATRELEAAVGTYNKLVFLAADGRYSIVGEKQGTWDGGIWYSNTNYRRPRVRPSRGYGIRRSARDRIWRSETSDWTSDDGWVEEDAPTVEVRLPGLWAEDALDRGVDIGTVVSRTEAGRFTTVAMTDIQLTEAMVDAELNREWGSCYGAYGRSVGLSAERALKYLDDASYDMAELL